MTNEPFNTAGIRPRSHGGTGPFKVKGGSNPGTYNASPTAPGPKLTRG